MMRAPLLAALLGAAGCGVFLPGVWLDTTTGLMWEEPPNGDRMTITEAETYCAELTTDDHDDWRLPDIDELRSLIAGCTVDYCDVSTTCTSASSLDPCNTDCLEGCFDEKGPGQDGCYRNEVLSGSCYNTWSSTPATGSVSDDYYWVIDFSDATFSYINANDLEQNVRCVRRDAPAGAQVP